MMGKELRMRQMPRMNQIRRKESSTMPRWLPTLSFVIALVATPVFADGLGDNDPAKVRRVPALGIEVAEGTRKELVEQLAVLKDLIDRLTQFGNRRAAELLPDVKIFHRAVHDALEYRELFNEKELPAAKKLLEQGIERARQLERGEAPWTSQTGLVVRGYVSRIDGSVQPYGLIVPDSYQPAGPHRHRLDLWFHGRGETLSEVNFLDQRQRDRGIFAPADTFVLHPYGRYCNAFKFAGEVDVLEALEAVEKQYRIDDDRISVRGFSMGGAACWQFAVHYADRWFAATPGAGFSETPQFLDFFQKEKLDPTPWEKTLWHWYDCNDWAVNLSNLPTIAYSGENDIQKQAADVMEEALARHGIRLTHLVGPKTGHSYHPATRDEIERRMTSIAARGRERVPRRIHFTTYTLKYNRMNWVTIDALGEHWKPARVDAHIGDDGTVTLSTENVRGYTLSFPAGLAPFDAGKPVRIVHNRVPFEEPGPESDRSWSLHSRQKEDGRWTTRADASERPASGEPLPPVKKHNLQGPIDDAFMDAFIFVRPTGQFAHPAVEAWVKAELDHAIEHWRRQFRGQARVKDDRAITSGDIASAHLILWGDPSSNAMIEKVAGQLPIRWNDKEIVAGQRRYSAEQHAPILIHPNPLNKERYIVLNSSFTYREYDYLNNARQVSRLPDWGIVDLRTPPDSRYPGKIVAADFFDENWKLKP
jgi:dienelactone hydrolase